MISPLFQYNNVSKLSGMYKDAPADFGREIPRIGLVVSKNVHCARVDIINLIHCNITEKFSSFKVKQIIPFVLKLYFEA